MKKTRINNPIYYFPQSALLILILLLILIIINMFEISLYANMLPFITVLILFLYDLFLYKKNNYIKYSDKYMYISRYYYEKTTRFTFHFFEDIKAIKTLKTNKIKKSDIKIVKLEDKSEELNTKFFKTKEISIVTNNEQIRLNILYYRKNSLKKVFNNLPIDNNFKEYLNR